MSCFVTSAPNISCWTDKRGSCKQSWYCSCCSCGGVQVAFYGDNLFVNQIIPPCSYIIRGIELIQDPQDSQFLLFANMSAPACNNRETYCFFTSYPFLSTCNVLDAIFLVFFRVSFVQFLLQQGYTHEVATMKKAIKTSRRILPNAIIYWQCIWIYSSS